MDQYVLNTIRLWAEALRKANENSTLLIENSSPETMDECARRMVVVDGYERDLVDIGVRDGLPQPLTNYLNARADKGCPSCWHSSGSQHDDCRRKIARFFRTRDDLMRFGLSVPHADV